MPSLDRIGLVSGALGRPLPAQRRPEPKEPLRKYQNWLPGRGTDVGGDRRARRLRGGGCERELIGERTRDKMSAARRKGKWVGGCPVLGYDVDPGRGRLVVNAEEAERVRTIFAL